MSAEPKKEALLAKTWLAFAVFASVAVAFRFLMLSFQTRVGVVITDPVLRHLGPWNLSPLIFLLTYLPLVFGILFLVREAWFNTQNAERGRYRVRALLYSYSLLQLFRLTCIYLLPLEAPDGMLILSDPISDHLLFGNVVTKDLFFSGHVSTLVLFSFYFEGGQQKWAHLFRVMAGLDALCLMAQHVHYTIDVMAAPIFAYAAFRACRQALPEPLSSHDPGRRP